MEQFMEYAVILVPMCLIEITLLFVSLIHVIRHPRYRFGNKVLWILIVCLIQFIGPIVYFTVGRGDE